MKKAKQLFCFAFFAFMLDKGRFQQYNWFNNVIINNVNYNVVERRRNNGRKEFE